eukprot:m.45223 g.45223  ORF g.45223 m.45223 type:complete len:263 (+) comp15164_c0_seq4:70-858(+)
MVRKKNVTQSHGVHTHHVQDYNFIFCAMSNVPGSSKDCGVRTSAAGWPPSYEQAVITAQPIAAGVSPYHGRDAASLIQSVREKLAAQGIQDDDIQGWFTVPDEYHRDIACQPWKYFLCPLLWLHLVICSPYILAKYFSARKTLVTMAFVVTKNGVITFVENSGPCSSCYTGGKDATHIPFKNIQNVVANEKDTGCLACCSVPAIDLTLSTMHSTGGKVCIVCFNLYCALSTPTLPGWRLHVHRATDQLAPSLWLMLHSCVDP